jgi:heme-degrading monooxygenase HmoA
MYAVTFRAEIAELDEEYLSTANRLRELAINEYGCTSFSSSTEGNQEITISHWPSKEHIAAWHENPEHKKAQSKGKSTWYKSYHIAITEL